MQKKILILGSSGLLGTALEEKCVADGRSYFALDHSTIEITEKAQLEQMVEEYKPEVVINTVALINTNVCEKDPARTLAVNSLPLFHLANICSKNGIVLCNSSTHSVFDGIRGDYVEEDPVCPINLYGQSKVLSEYFMKMNTPNHYIFRFATMFGKRRNSSMGFVDKMIKLMKDGKDLRVAEDKIDSPTYTCHVAGKIFEILDSKMPFGVYHVANSGKANYHEFISQVAEEIGYTGQIARAKDEEFVKLALAPNPRIVNINSTKLTPMPNWREALREYIQREGIKC